MKSIKHILEKVKKDQFFYRFKRELGSINLNNNNKIVVSISGGVDSVGLLFLLKALGRFQLILVHVNHGFRARSIIDEKFIKNLSREIHIPLFLKKLDPSSIKKNKNVEQWGRENRYKYLEKISIKTASKVIMTGHHGNDQIETILMNIHRGSGVLGMRGIAKRNKKLIRPLLKFSKEEIILFSERVGYRYCEDETNNNLNFRRNFVRNNIVKPWESRYPSLIKGFTNTAKNISNWQDSFDFMVVNYIIPKIKIPNGNFVIDKKLFLDYPKILRTRIIHLLAKENLGMQWSRHKINMLDNFFNKNNIGSIFELSKTFRLLIDRRYILGEKVRETSNLKINNLKINKWVAINNANMQLCVSTNKKDILLDSSEIVDWSKLKNKKISIRNWKRGDAFRPLGLNNYQKLSDFFINNKINQFKKEIIPLMIVNKEIIWVCGLRISDKVKVTKKTSEFANLLYKDLN